ncbi:hypothetical protein NH340_JMT07808 [Sarcoptes scabiei]|nr:hypothetical protein NH340_JMT07808 [Sarcoptes scabiei]
MKHISILWCLFLLWILSINLSVIDAVNYKGAHLKDKFLFGSSMFEENPIDLSYGSQSNLSESTRNDGIESRKELGWKRLNIWERIWKRIHEKRRKQNEEIDTKKNVNDEDLDRNDMFARYDKLMIPNRLSEEQLKRLESNGISIPLPIIGCNPSNPIYEIQQ